MPVFVPVMLMAVAACQWFPLKKVLPVSLWWLLSALFASLGYFTNLAGNLAIGFYTGGILMAAFQYFLLRKHNPQGGLFFAMATLFCWWLFGSFFYYVLGAAVSDRTSRLFVPMELRVLSYYGLVITWSSVLVGLIAARFIKPADTTPTLSA